MKINPVHFTFEPRKIMNPPPIKDEYFFIKYLREQREKSEINTKNVEIKLEKGQWPQGWYGMFPNELWKKEAVKQLEFPFVQEIKPIYRPWLNQNVYRKPCNQNQIIDEYKQRFDIERKINIKV